jgi:hypothetical protein
LTRKESGFIAEILTLAAIQAGRNVVIDGILSGAMWHVQLIETLRSDCKCHILKFVMLHITAPARTIQLWSRWLYSKSFPHEHVGEKTSEQDDWSFRREKGLEKVLLDSGETASLLNYFRTRRLGYMAVWQSCSIFVILSHATLLWETVYIKNNACRCTVFL